MSADDRNSIGPADVIEMAKKRALSPVLIANWMEQMEEDPVSAARRCLESRRRRLRWAFLIGTTAVVLFLLTIFFNILLFFVFPVAILLAAVLGTRADEKAEAFAQYDDGFGANLRGLCDLFARKPEELRDLSEEILRPMATEALVLQAKKVLKAEDADVRYFESSDPDNYTARRYQTDYDRNKIRDQFIWYFDVMKHFGFADPDGWGSYYKTAKEELAVERVAA